MSMLDESKDKALKILGEEKLCCLATMGERFVDNATVAYYNEGFDLYFGAFEDTLKCRNIKVNPIVAVAIGSLQMHGKAERVEHNTDMYEKYREAYLTKFPHYDFYFSLPGNELYRIKPLVIWLYDGAKGIMHRDTIVFDREYYERLMPYEPPAAFRKG